VNTRTIERVDVFPTRLPVVKTFEFASGSAGTAGGTAPHVFARVTDSQGRGAHGRARLVRASCDSSLRSYLGGSDGQRQRAVRVKKPLTTPEEVCRVPENVCRKGFLCRIRGGLF
jgi:hypothetical protein